MFYHVAFVRSSSNPLNQIRVKFFAQSFFRFAKVILYVNVGIFVREGFSMPTGVFFQSPAVFAIILLDAFFSTILAKAIDHFFVAWRTEKERKCALYFSCFHGGLKTAQTISFFSYRKQYLGTTGKVTHLGFFWPPHSGADEGPGFVAEKDFA